MFTFEGKRALVTGASSGIGYEIARELHRRGASLIVTARRTDRLQDLQQQCGGANRCEIITADLYAHPEQERVADLIAERDCDIVINNAGRGSFGAYETIPLQSELAMVSLNISAFMVMTHAAINHFKKRGGHGALLGVSSIAAFQPLPFLATYAATKAFEHHLYRGIRAELAHAKSNIHLTLLNPGPTATEFSGVARVPGTVTGGRRDNTAVVARRALDGLAANQPYIVPTWYSQLLALSSRFTPVGLSTALAARALGKVVERMANR